MAKPKKYMVLRGPRKGEVGTFTGCVGYCDVKLYRIQFDDGEVRDYLKSGIKLIKET